MAEKQKGQEQSGRQAQKGQQGQTRQSQKSSAEVERDRIAGHRRKSQEDIEREKAATGRTAQGGPEGAEGVDWRDEDLIEEPKPQK